MWPNRGNQFGRGRGCGRKNRKTFFEDKQFQCHTCYVGFNTTESYNEHMSKHIKCDHQGCNFEASYNRLEKHKLTHQFQSTKSDAWLEQRKRRFPGKRDSEPVSSAPSSSSLEVIKLTYEETDTGEANEQEGTTSEKVRKLLADADNLEKIEFDTVDTANQSFLGKLLTDEEKHRLLQCVKFVVQNNFLQE